MPPVPKMEDIRAGRRRVPLRKLPRELSLCVCIGDCTHTFCCFHLWNSAEVICGTTDSTAMMTSSRSPSLSFILGGATPWSAVLPPMFVPNLRCEEWQSESTANLTLIWMYIPGHAHVHVNVCALDPGIGQVYVIGWKVIRLRRLDSWQSC